MNRNRFWTRLEPEHPQVEAFCRRLAGNREDGDDLYQDALVAALNKVETLRDEDSFRPWLYRIVVNTFRNRLRQPWWRRRGPLTEAALNRRKTEDPSPRYAARRWLERAIKPLTADERALISLYELEGWSVTELAELFQCPSGTIKARLSRTRKKMRKEIGKYLSRITSNDTENEADYAMPRSKTANE